MNDNVSGGIVTATPAQISVLGSGQGGLISGGTVGERLLAHGFNINCLRTCASEVQVHGNTVRVNGTLLEDEWKAFDTTVQQVAREKLVVTNLLLNKGLRSPLPNALGVMTLEWERVTGDLVDAEVTMSGLNEAQKDRMAFETVSMPIPIIHKEFFYNVRHLEAARRNGRQPDVSHASVAARKVAELIERTIFTGVTIGGTAIYGMLNHPQRKTQAVTATWVTATGEQIVADMVKAIDALSNVNNNHEGPFYVFVPTLVAAHMGEDYKANSDKTIMQRVMEVPGVAGIQSTGRLTGTNVLVVQLTSDVIEMIDGIQPTMVEWDSHGGFQKNFKVISIMLPRVRSDGWNQSGILHMS